MSQLTLITNVVLTTGYACLMLTSTGCKGVGDAFIPHHPASYVKEDCYTTIVLSRERAKKDREPASIAVSAAAITTFAAGVLVDQTVKAAEIEAKKYKASYSARTSDYFIDSDGLPIRTILIERNHIGKDGKVDNLFKFTMSLESNTNNGVFRLKPEEIEIRKTASKVFAIGMPKEGNDFWQYAPWRWPAMLVWGPWRLMDDSLTKVDYNVRIVIEGVVWNDKKEGKTVVLCAQDFPVGKWDIQKIAQINGVNETRGLEELGCTLQLLDTGFMPLVMPKTLVEKPDLPLNVTVTVTEGNDLGDIIGKGAVELKDNKEKIVKVVVEKVGEVTK